MHFFCIFCGNSISNQIVSLDEFCFSDNTLSFRCVREDEVLKALDFVKSSSVAVDDIPIKFIKIIYPFVSDLILHIFNNIIMRSEFPICWKTARVVPIPKKGIVKDLEDLRPISILPALSKVIEHLLKEQILEMTTGKIYESQYAYRVGHTTTFLLLELTETIRRNVNGNKFSALISLDLSKAFNCLDHFNMMIKLKNFFGFSRSACKLILSYLSERSQFISLNNSL